MIAFHKAIALLLVSVTLYPVHGQKSVTDQTMQRIYEEVKTPYKYGLVLAPDNNVQKMDCPTIYRKDDTWFMSYIVFNGRGYETWLAQSDDLLHWKTIGKILSFQEGNTWDRNQSAGYMALVDPQWEGSYALQTFDRKYWLSYFGGNTQGYEAGILSIGMAYSQRMPDTAFEWERLPAPVLRPDESDAQPWERKRLFKNTVIEDKERRTGHRFVMYYNALGEDTVWTERIGIAFSDDLKTWRRYDRNPVLDHHTGITGDAYLQKIGDVWVMFYFGYRWDEFSGGAFNRFACSYDLLNWTDWQGEHLLQPSEPYDSIHAHKPCVVKWNGIVYHFYCAVNQKDQRGIAVATSKDLGTSDLHFIP